MNLMISFKVNEKLKEKLEKKAKEEKRSRSNLIKYVLETYLEKEDAK